MDTLEATVEIVKATMSASGHPALINYIADEEQRKEFLTGVEEIYQKLKSLTYPDKR